jgi:hypothetical protein
MNSFKKLVELTSIRLFLAPRQIKYSISRKDWMDFALVLMVSTLIFIYKINKEG